MILTLAILFTCLFQVLGRNVRDFINELDNLHEYFRFSFPKVQPPSFCVEEECETSLTLHYRSTRKGFTQFVKGNKKNIRGGNAGCYLGYHSDRKWICPLNLKPS